MSHKYKSQLQRILNHVIASPLAQCSLEFHRMCWLCFHPWYFPCTYQSRLPLRDHQSPTKCCPTSSPYERTNKIDNRHHNKEMASQNSHKQSEWQQFSWSLIDFHGPRRYSVESNTHTFYVCCMVRTQLRIWDILHMEGWDCWLLSIRLQLID